MHFRYRLTLFLVIALVGVQAATAFFAYDYLQVSLIAKGFPRTVILDEFRAVAWPMALILGAALLVSLAGALLIARSLLRPLEALAFMARRIAAGDYSLPELVRTGHELDQLSTALANMAHAIAEREAALTAAITTVEAARNEAVLANEAKSRFLANMSHELRTPLNAMVGFSEMIGGQVLGPIGKLRYLEYARDISDSGKHLLTQVSQMLDLAEAETGRLRIEQSEFALAALVQRAIIRFLPLAEKGGVVLTGPDDMSNWPLLVGDAAKLEQAVGGIIHNAIKFTPAGGHVDVTGTFHSEDRFALIVADSGIGMDELAAETVTRPFQRPWSSFDGDHQGAGLGLSFARAIVEAHHGGLRLKSELAVGTRLEMEFPVHAAIASNAA